jgi:triosephosphate isomerase
MRKPIIIGNWKMNMRILDGLNFLEDLEKIKKQMDKDMINHNLEIGIAPQAIALRPMILSSDNVLIGAQNCSEHLRGAYTGEISAELLAEIRINFCIVGHSERRQYFQETDELVNEKAKVLLEHKVMPVICVGETLEQYEANETKEVIEEQIAVACQDLEIEK